MMAKKSQEVAKSRKKSQKESILEYMADGNSITQLDALSLFGCARLAARIGDLRKDGYPIRSKMVKVPTRDGYATVSQYWMEE